MHGSRSHRISPLIAVLSLTALLAVCCTGASLGATKPWPTPRQAVPQLGGTWSGKYGGSYSGTFTIHGPCGRAA